MRKLLYWLLLLVVPTPSFTQVPNLLYRKLDARDGLQASTFYQIIQDSTGYIWILHNEGLSRYNGISFHHFSSGEGIRPGPMLRAAIDQEQRLWVVALDGSVFQQEGDHFREPSGLPKETAKWIISNSKGHITLGYNNGEIWLITPKAKRCIKAAHPREIMRTGIWLNDSVLFYSDKSTVYRLKLPEGKSTSLGGEFPYQEGFIRFYRTQKGVCYSKNHSLFELSSGKLIYKGTQEIIDVTHKNEEYWIAGANSLIRFRDKVVKTVLQAPVSCLMQDAEQGLWFSGQSGFYQVLQENWQLHSTFNPVVLHAGNWGLLALDENYQLWMPGSSSPQPPRPLKPGYCRNDIRFGKLPAALAAYAYQCISIISQQGVYITTHPVQQQFYVRSVASGTIQWDGSLLIHLELPEVEKKGGHYFVQFQPDPLSGSFRLRYFPTDIKINPPEQLFLFGSDSLLYIHQNKWICLDTNATPIDSGKLSLSNLLSPVLINDRELCWTDSLGYLNMGNPWKISVRIKAPPLETGEIILGVIKSQNQLWLRTKQRIYYKVHPTAATWENFSFKTIQPEISIQDMCYWNDSVWVATNKGLFHFATTDMGIHHWQEKVMADSLFVENTPFRWNPFGPSGRTLQVLLSKINFNPGADNQIRVKTGNYTFSLRDGWQQLAFDLPGEHLLELYPGNSNNGKTLLAFQLPHFWWEPVWVKTSGLLLLIFMLLWFTRALYKKRIRDIQLKKSIAVERLRSLQSQINPHFMYNTLTSVQHYVLTREKDQTLIYISDFSQLMRGITHFSQQENILLQEELDFLKLYLELEQRRMHFQYELILDEEVLSLSEEILLPPLLVQPLVENAIKHGIRTRKQEGNIWIQFKLKHNQEPSLEVKITDNGNGFSADYSTGTGLKNTRARLHNLWQKPGDYLWIQSDSMNGTQVSLIFPITYA